MDMNMASSSSMDPAMASMTPTSSAGMSMSTASSMGSMGGMDMGGGACKISMLWNWDTVDACFLSETWHITSPSMFAGSCIGVIALVIVLEFLRRVGREYDRFIAPKPTANPSQPACQTPSPAANKAWDPSSAEQSPRSGSSLTESGGRGPMMPMGPSGGAGSSTTETRPKLLQQIIRATIHMLQFAVAYFVMLLAMYYNGYFIICIFIGAWIGSFVFSWDQLAAKTENDATAVTVCCG